MRRVIGATFLIIVGLFAAPTSAMEWHDLDRNQQTLVDLIAEELFLEETTVQKPRIVGFSQLPAKRKQQYRLRAISTLAYPAQKAHLREI